MPTPQTFNPIDSLDDDLVWQELTQVARRTLREQAETDSFDEPLRVRHRVRAADGTDRWYEVRTEPLLHEDDKPTVVVMVVDSGEAEPEQPAPPRRKPRQLGRALSPRQRQVAQLLALRLTTKEIAKRLSISHNTARRHVEAVYGRLGVHRRAAVGEVLRSA